ncbi:glyoxalase [Lewinellaceae bacterium SD302]|nr:glyoxalase [Lewinellaceae bacterium SD302]
MKYTLPILLLTLLSCNATPEPVTAEPPPAPVVDQDSIAADRFVFDHYAVIVEDLERAADFYLNVMNLEEVYDATEKDHIRWFDLGPGMALHVIEDPASKDIAISKPVHLALTMKNFTGFVDKMREMEYPFQNWPGQADTTNLRPDGVAQIYLQDPDGYWIEINDAANF